MVSNVGLCSGANVRCRQTIAKNSSFHPKFDELRRILQEHFMQFGTSKAIVFTDYKTRSAYYLRVPLPFLISPPASVRYVIISTAVCNLLYRQCHLSARTVPEVTL